MKKWWFVSLSFWVTAALYLPLTDKASAFGSLVQAVFVVAALCWCIIDLRYDPLHADTEEDVSD